MRLIDVYSTDYKDILYKILEQRQPQESISHKEMPSWDEHCAFVDSRPYQIWYIILTSVDVGTIYLTDQREIGVFISPGFRGQGLARQAIELLRERHPGRILANVNPANYASRKLWESMGGKLIQVTFEIE